MYTVKTQDSPPSVLGIVGTYHDALNEVRRYARLGVPTGLYEGKTFLIGNAKCACCGRVPENVWDAVEVDDDHGYTYFCTKACQDQEAANVAEYDDYVGAMVDAADQARTDREVERLQTKDLW